jgi:hypothetical protein
MNDYIKVNIGWLAPLTETELSGGMEAEFGSSSRAGSRAPVITPPIRIHAAQVPRSQSGPNRIGHTKAKEPLNGSGLELIWETAQENQQK